MTPKQLMERLRDSLRAAVWEGTSNKIFGSSVYVVPSIPIEQLSRYRSPCAFVIDIGAKPQDEHPGILDQNGQIVFFVENLQNPYGDSGMLGGCRIDDTSAGAGYYDVGEDLLNYLIETVTLTTKIMIIETGSPRPQFVGDNTPLIFGTISFSALVSIY